jgi:isopenicillin-N N-acyltransferase-like protein
MRTNDMPVVKLSGAGRVRGRQYGETLRSKIADLVPRWEAQVDGGNSAKALIDDILRETRFDRAIARWAPDLWEEVQGIAEGSGQPLWKIQGIQLLDEVWWFTLYRRAGKAPWREHASIPERCSALGQVRASAATYSGQNMDIGTWIEGNQVLLRIEETAEAPAHLVFSYAGSIGLNGLNAQGIGYCCNTLIQLDPSATGLPMAYVGRRVLQQRTFDDALGILRGVEHASGQNYLLGAPGRLGSYECSGNHAIEWKGEHGPDGPLLHTNHPLASREDRIFTQMASGEAMRSTTEGRYDGLKRCAVNGPLGVETIKETLASKEADAPISRTGETIAGNPIGYTVGCTIYEHTDDPVLHLASGPPCSTEFREFRP